MIVYETQFSGMHGRGLLFAEIKRNFPSEGWAYNEIGHNLVNGFDGSADQLNIMEATVADYCANTPMSRPDQVAHTPSNLNLQIRLQSHVVCVCGSILKPQETSLRNFSSIRIAVALHKTTEARRIVLLFADMLWQLDH